MKELDISSLQPVQVEFLEHIASKPDELTKVLSESRISPRRMATWLGDPVFRAAYMLRCSHYEEMLFPAFLAGIRKKALGEGKDSYRFAQMYMDVFKERSEALLQQGNALGDPVKEEPDQEGTGQLPGLLEGYEDLGQEDISDLIEG